MRTIFAVALLLSTPAFAQNLLATKSEQHRFFDKQNIALFSAVAAVRIADMDSTWRFRSIHCQHYPTRVVNGIMEFPFTACGPSANEVMLSNSFVDNKPAFAAYSLGMVGAHVVSSYFLHRTGHHRLERWSAIVHIAYMGAWNVHNYQVRGFVQPITIYPGLPSN